MKKIIVLVTVLVVFFAIAMTTGCKKSSSPSGPVATNVPTPIASYTDLASVPQGTYTQEDTNGNSFTATVSAFKMGEYMVTYDLWTTVYKWATTTSAASSAPTATSATASTTSR